MAARTELRSFRSKILLGYGAAILAIVLISFLAVASLLTLGRATDSILSENYKSILAAENMINALERQDSVALSWLLGIQSAAREEFQGQEVDFLQWLGRARDNITIPGEEAILEDIQSGYSSLMAHAATLFSTATAGGPTLDLYRQNIHPLISSIRSQCTSLHEINQQAMFNASDRARALARGAVWRTSLGGSAVVLFGLGFGLFISNRLAKPVERMREATNRLADGFYDTQVPVEGADELSDLAVQFNQMAKRLKGFHDLNIGQIVAEKHKSEAILQSVDDGILVVDTNAHITNINPTAAAIFACSPDAVTDRHFLECVGDDRLYEYVRHCLEAGSPPEIPEDESILTREISGEKAHFHFSVIPVRIKAGPVMSVVLLFRNVTRLRELDRLKSEFVMTASHELRTPLTSIGMSVDMLLEKSSGKLNTREQELLTIASEDIHRLKALVNELLDLSRIEAGRLELELDRVPVQLICDKAKTVMGPQADDKSITLAFETAAHMPRVCVDANKITWVLVNLIGNALRHTPPKGTVNISTCPAGDFVEVAVQDSGEGIPIEYQSKIFDKFVQVESGRTTGGSGLGLAICREIVRAHGGTIWVDSIPGKGSTFTFSVPVDA